MKKSLLASSVAIALGASGSASALTVNITEMIFGGNPFVATGQIDDVPSDQFNSVTPFYGFPWTADTVAFFGPGSSTSWADTGGGNTNDAVANGTYNYAVTTTANQVAWGTFFDWNGTYDIPVLAKMTCSGFNPGDTCTGIGTPMQTAPFPGQDPAFSGTVISSSSTNPVPVPAAAWLMGSGLVGLVGVARRRKTNKS